MKIAIVCILVLIGCAILWAYQTHPDAFQDALADFTHDPNGARTLLENTQKQCADLTTTNKSLESENDTLKINIKKLNDKIVRLNEEITHSNGEIAQLKAALASSAVTAAPPVTIKKTFVPPSPLPSQPNWTWTTSDGKTYKNVVITKVEADCVTILHADGGARINIATLPPDIQKQLNYDPDLAAEASSKRTEQEKAADAALAKEIAARNARLQAEALKEQAAAAAAQPAEPTPTPTPAPPPAPPPPPSGRHR